MTEKRETIDRGAVELMGQMIEAQMGATHRVMNDLSDEGWRTAREWAERYRDLMESIYKANDSLRVERVLNSHPSPPSDDTLDHYRHMAHDATITQK